MLHRIKKYLVTTEVGHDWYLAILQDICNIYKLFSKFKVLWPFKLHKKCFRRLYNS
jgi:hypothetical protein